MAKINQSMAYRLITQSEAEWIGNAASVAGGFVAVCGPRLWDDERCLLRRLLMVVPAGGPLCDEGIPCSPEKIEWIAKEMETQISCTYDADERAALEGYLSIMLDTAVRTYDVFRQECRAGGEMEWIGEIKSDSEANALHNARLTYECDDVHRIVVELAPAEIV